MLVVGYVTLSGILGLVIEPYLQVHLELLTVNLIINLNVCGTSHVKTFPYLYLF